MKLEKAKFCVRCREIILKPSNGICPVCAGKGIFPLTQIIPVMTIIGKALWIKLDIQGMEATQKERKGFVIPVCQESLSKKNSRQAGKTTGADINKIKKTIPGRRGYKY